MSAENKLLSLKLPNFDRSSVSKFGTSFVLNTSAENSSRMVYKFVQQKCSKLTENRGVKVSSVTHCILVQKFSNLNSS